MNVEFVRQASCSVARVVDQRGLRLLDRKANNPKLFRRVVEY